MNESHNIQCLYSCSMVLFKKKRSLQLFLTWKMWVWKYTQCVYVILICKLKISSCKSTQCFWLYLIQAQSQTGPIHPTLSSVVNVALIKHWQPVKVFSNSGAGESEKGTSKQNKTFPLHSTPPRPSTKIPPAKKPAGLESLSITSFGDCVVLKAHWQTWRCCTHIVDGLLMACGERFLKTNLL